MGASKCAKGSQPPCREACPAGVDVPRYIRYIREGRYDLALAVIRERIPFPAVCGHACVHPCETKCARAQYDQAVAIRMLKRAAEEKGDGGWQKQLPEPVPSGKKVAVIGAGPGGLTAAYYLAGKGYQVTVFEARDKPGGMMRYGIPRYRLPEQVLERDIAAITRLGVEIRTGVRVKSPGDLKEYDAVFVAVGAWKGAGGGMAGDGPLDGVTFLNEVNSGKPVALGKKVAVIGGGNTAVDAARAAVRLGAREVKLIYRRTRDEMPAGAEEVTGALEEGVEIEFLAAPVKLEKGRLICIRMTLGAKDRSGRPAPEPVAGSEFSIPCDTVIAAVGQRADAVSIGLAANPDGTVKVNPDTLETEKKGVFAAGDCVTGPSSIIQAIAQGRQAAGSIDRYLGGSGEIRQDLAGENNSRYQPAPMGVRRPAAPNIPLGERLNSFSPVEMGYDDLAARREARRCLACDLTSYSVEVDFKACKECGYCREVCKLDIFQPADSFNDRGYRPMTVVGGDKCVGCQKCFFVCPDFAVSIQKVGGDQR